MAIPTPVCNGLEGGRPSAPLIPLDISVAGENIYPAGGMTGAAAAFQAAARTAGYKLSFTKANIHGLVMLDGFGYQLAYDKADDKLKVYYGNNDGGADGPGIEATGENLSGVTFRFTLLVS